MDLLEIPCVSVVNGVPESHWDCTFGGFDFSDQEKLKELTQQFLAGEPYFWLYLWGLPGRGKTHYAVALHRALVALRGWEGVGSSAFIEWSVMCEDLRSGLSDYSYDDRLRAYMEAETLLIDDLIGKQTDFQVKILEQIIRDRHSGRKRLVITSNEHFDRFSSVFSAHEVSRISQVCAWVQFGGVDRRQG